MGSLRSLLVVLYLLWQPIAAAADGYVYIRKDLQGTRLEVEATEQRALLWQRANGWEIHIQPRFSREPGAAAWVVPFADRPEVSPGSSQLFDDLDFYTSPIFYHYCVWSSADSGGCSGDDDSGSGSSESRGAETHVRVWERGEVGELDYVVLSARDGDSLATWLNDHDFAVPESAVELLDQYNDEGSYFFAARLSPDADPEKPLAPVRFLLPLEKLPSYPLRMTALGVPEGETMELTLWLAFPVIDEYDLYYADPSRSVDAGDGGSVDAGDGAIAEAGDGGSVDAGDGGSADTGDGGSADAGDGGSMDTGEDGSADAGDGSSEPEPFHGYVPASHPFLPLEQGSRDSEEYEDALNAFFEIHPADTMALLTNRVIDGSPNGICYDTYDCCPFTDCNYGYYTEDDFTCVRCLNLNRVGIEPPGELSLQFQWMYSERTYLYRFQARFDARALDRDLTLKPIWRSQRPLVSNVYERSLGRCSGCSNQQASCAASGELQGLPAAMVPLAVAVLLFRRRLRRRRSG